METPIMYSEVLDAIHAYFLVDEEIEVDCLRYLASLQYNSTLACQLGAEADYKINQMGRCEKCGEKFQIAHYKEPHPEIGPGCYEDMTEPYCPNCDIGKMNEEMEQYD